MTMPVVFLLGPSGAGKTTVGDWIAADLDFCHVQIDSLLYNGIDHEGLRSVWSAFEAGNDAVALAEAVRKKWGHKAGVVLSFPSTQELSIRQIRAAESEGVTMIILYSAREDCRNAFLKREDNLPPGSSRLDAAFWEQCNPSGRLSAWGSEAYSPYRIMAFNKDHTQHYPHVLGPAGACLRGTSRPAGPRWPGRGSRGSGRNNGPHASSWPDKRRSRWWRSSSK